MQAGFLEVSVFCLLLPNTVRNKPLLAKVSISCFCMEIYSSGITPELLVLPHSHLYVRIR